MSWQTFYVPKRSGTYSDVLVAYGLASLIDTLTYQATRGQATWRITLEDVGSHYRVHTTLPVEEAWLQAVGYFQPRAKYIIRGKGEAIPPGLNARDVNEMRAQVQTYAEQRRALKEAGVKGSDLEGQIEDLKPPADWQVTVFIGDGRMQAIGTYNRILSQWPKLKPVMPQTLRCLLETYATPSTATDSVCDEWERRAKSLGVELRETASQLLNPHQGKGLNEPKSHALRVDNVKDRPWPEEFLKVLGLWECMAPRQVMDTQQDWKVYVLAPLRLSLEAHRDAFRRFNNYLWQERLWQERGQATALKADITSVLLFTKAWLDYTEARYRGGVRDLLSDEVAPERVVAGFHVAQFKKLSPQAYTMVNLSFLRLPSWSGDLRTRQDVDALKSVIDEHLAVIRDINENHSDGFELLRRYRDFVAGNKWDAFFDFLVGYSHYLLRRLDQGEQWVATFTTTGLGRLIMSSRKELSRIVENPGFQNVAYAIRHSTIIPQTRKARHQDNLYEVRYGLGAELKRKATVRDEFVAALMEFIQSYNQENVQKLESKGKQMRKDIRTSDVEEVVRLIDEYGSEVVANLLIAYGYAREPREEEEM